MASAATCKGGCDDGGRSDQQLILPILSENLKARLEADNSKDHRHEQRGETVLGMKEGKKYSLKPTTLITAPYINKEKKKKKTS